MFVSEFGCVERDGNINSRYLILHAHLELELELERMGEPERRKG